MEELYLLELLLEKFCFKPTVKVPPKNQMNVLVTIGTLVSLELGPEYLAGKEPAEGVQNVAAIDYNSGKSYLFPCKPQSLLDILAKDPLVLTVNDTKKGESIASLKIVWSKDFMASVKASQKGPSASTKGSFVLKDKDDQVVGKLDLYLRLSCFGKSIQTQYQVMPGTPSGKAPAPRQFFFKSIDADPTMWQCQRFGSGTSSEALPVAPLYKSAEIGLIKPADEGANLTPGEKLFIDLMHMKSEDMTAEKIAKILCKCRACPGLKKFGEYGIGPLSTGELDIDCGVTNIPLGYGLRHTCAATMDTYGPSGAYTRPKSLDQPFVPKDRTECYAPDCYNNPDCNKFGSCNNPRCKPAAEDDSCYPSSRKGSSKSPRKSSAKGAGCCGKKSGLAGGRTILRLRGGGGSSTESSSSKIPAPMVECKDLMDDFDKVLVAYKKALGPCGQTTCPHAPNILDAKCKTCCGATGGGLGLESLPENLTTCPTQDCPKMRRQSGRAVRPSACGSPVCPFTKKIIPHDDDDDFTEMELNAPLKPPKHVAQLCGKPKCPHPIVPQKPLEPIHWDCPEPLPKGLCTNPDCPYLPRMYKYFPPPKGPCGGLACPHGEPQTCGKPSCPPGKPQQGCPPPPGCANPRCPFAPKPGCPKPGCPAPPSCPPLPCPPKPPCPHPSCPFASPPYPPPSTSCPFARPPCANQSCPFAPPPCPPPKCPFVPSECFNPDCPLTAISESVCDNPDCPYAASLAHTDDLCSNPDCPFADNSDSLPVCDNPGCPFAKKQCPPPPCPQSQCPPPQCPPPQCPPPPCMPPPCGGPVNVCNVPNCPYSTPLPPCYGQPCPPPSCPGMPCPPPAEPCYPPPQVDEVCSNPDCPYATKKSSPCYLPQEETCDNPACPFSKKPSPCYLPPGSCPPPAICPPAPCPYEPPPCGQPGCPFDVGATKPPPAPEPLPPIECGFGTTKISIEIGGGDINVDCKSNAGDVQQKSSKGSKRHSQSEPALSKGGGQKALKESSKSEKAIPDGGDNGKKKKGAAAAADGLVKYPGVQLGHRECVTPGFPVPRKMGWLWNINVPCVGLKPRRGWRPGAVGRSIAAKILAHKRARAKLLEELANVGKKRPKVVDSNATVAPKPTLRIKKEKGSYYITVNPLKDPKTHLDPNPYLDCTPMQFKVSKNKKVISTDPNALCVCGDGNESEDSGTLDFEFTPPAGLPVPPKIRKKRQKVYTNVITQYDPADFTPPKPPKGKGGKGGKGGKKGKK